MAPDDEMSWHQHFVAWARGWLGTSVSGPDTRKILGIPISDPPMTAILVRTSCCTYMQLEEPPHTSHARSRRKELAGALQRSAFLQKSVILLYPRITLL